MKQGEQEAHDDDDGGGDENRGYADHELVLGTVETDRAHGGELDAYHDGADGRELVLGSAGTDLVHDDALDAHHESEHKHAAQAALASGSGSRSRAPDDARDSNENCHRTADALHGNHSATGALQIVDAALEIDDEARETQEMYLTLKNRDDTKAFVAADGTIDRN